MYKSLYFKSVNTNYNLLERILKLFDFEYLFIIIDTELSEDKLKDYNLKKIKKINSELIIKISKNDLSTIKMLCSLGCDLFIICLKNPINEKEYANILKQNYFFTIDYWQSEKSITISLDKNANIQALINNLTDIINRSKLERL